MGFIPEEYRKISRYNEPRNLKHLPPGNILNTEEIESMCDLQFTITELTHQRLQRDGDIRECAHHMLAEHILWYNTRNNTGQIRDVLYKLV